jgi:hypothetical protein
VGKTLNAKSIYTSETCLKILKDADILIVEVGTDGRFLLFPPLGKDHVSARMGDHDCELVVQFRGVTGGEMWKESFILGTEDPEAAKYWLDILGTVPIPPPIVRKEMVMDSALASEISSGSALNYTDDIPLGSADD